MSRSLTAAVAAAVVALLAVAPVQPAAAYSYDIVCRTDTCDGGAWQAARDQSYWGMGAGHNCTNFVAWKLIGNGVERPVEGLGDAAQWAREAKGMGVLVDDVPTVGSVAQWNAFASQMGRYGHVAYVEKVYADGTLLISEDSWRPDGGGPLTYRTVAASTVSNFIHFGDLSRWVREVAFELPTPLRTSDGLTPVPDAAAPAPAAEPRPGLRIPGDPEPEPTKSPTKEPTKEPSEDGTKVPTATPTPAATPSPTTTPAPTVAPTAAPTTPPAPAPEPTAPPADIPTPTPTPTALPVTGATDPTVKIWQERTTGLLASPTAMSGAYAGGAPQLVYAEDGDLKVAKKTADGWTVERTGIRSEARTIDTVDMGGALPEVMSLEKDELVRTVSTGGAWQKMRTGVGITGEIAALNTGGLWPTVMVSQGGKLYRVWGGAEGWQAEETGAEVWGPITAVNVGGSVPTVFSIENGMIQRIWLDAVGWHKESTGIQAKGSMDAVEIEGSAQVILAQDGAVFQVIEDLGGWRKTAIDVASGTSHTAINTGVGTPLIMQAG